MENQIDSLLESINMRFPEARFEIIHNSFSPSLKHFIIRDNYSGKGFGTDHDCLIAIQKAYSEYVERKTLIQLDKLYGSFKSSNGFAAHLTKSLAKESSIFELIERDAFLIAWHSYTAPYWLSDIEIKKILGDENFLIVNEHNKFNLKLNLGIVAKSNKVLTCIAKVQGKYKGKDFFFIDTKSGTDLSRILNSLVEGITFFSHFLSQSDEHFNRRRGRKLIKPIDHFFYYLNTESEHKWFSKKTSKVIEIPAVGIQSYIFSPNELLGTLNTNRYVCFSESKEMQSYYCGEFRLNKNININRFENVFDHNFVFNKSIHPLS